MLDILEEGSLVEGLLGIVNEQHIVSGKGGALILALAIPTMRILHMHASKKMKRLLFDVPE